MDVPFWRAILNNVGGLLLCVLEIFQSEGEMKMPRTLQQFLVCVLLVVLSLVLLHWAFPETIHARDNVGKVLQATECDRKHVAQCKRSIRYWREKAHKAQAAIKWQKKVHKEKLDLLLFNQPVKQLAAWTCIHNGTPVNGGQPGTNGQGEGPWNANSGNGYYGGLQMDRGFMAAYGARLIRYYSRDGSAGFANEWTPKQQMNVAQIAHDSGRGFRPWPNTARECGLL